MPPKAAAARPVQKKKPTQIHKLPDPIREGEIVKDIQKRQWRLGKSIGVGGFGEIYAASDVIDKPVATADAKYVIKIEPHSNGPLFVEMNFYIRVAKADFIEEWMKTKKMKFLGMPRFVGSGSHEYKGEKYRFMVMQRFGTDVHKLFEAAQRRFPINTVVNLSLRIIDVLEYIHEKQYVHADIKGSNLLLGFGKGNENQVWLVDFGLACRYTVDGVHKEYKPDLRKAHNGTIEFTSRDAHIGANSRRGDFEILGYNMLQWLCGRLPWEDNLTDQEYVASQKNKYMSNLPQLMKQCFSGSSPPGFIVRFLEMVAQLKFDEKPNYDKFRQILRAGLKEAGLPDNGVLDFASTSSGSRTSARTPVKRRTSPVKVDDEMENGPNNKQRSKPALKKSREPCSPKVTNRVTRRANSTTESSSDTSTPSLSSVAKKRSAAEMNKKESDTPAEKPAKRDTSLCNPTPAMLAILEKMRNRDETPPSIPAKKKQARLDSRSCSPIDLDTSSILTPAMEEVIRVREIRKSMEVSRMEQSRFFTPVCSPMVDDAESNGPFSRERCPYPASTPLGLAHNLHMTLDLSSEEEEPLRRKKSSGSSIIPVTRSTRSRNRPVTLDSTASSSVESSTAGERSVDPTPDSKERRVVFKRRYRVVEMTSTSTQTSPGVLKLPPVRKVGYSLRSAQHSTPGGKKDPPVLVDLSPDMFNDGSP